MSVTLSNLEAQDIRDILQKARDEEQNLINAQIRELEEKRQSSHIDALINAVSQFVPESDTQEQTISPNN